MGSYDHIIWPVIGTYEKEQGVMNITSLKCTGRYKTHNGLKNVEIHFKRELT